MTDRGLWLAGLLLAGNVRRLMYQTLIWAAVLRHDARGLGAAFDAEDLKGLADALIGGMRREQQFARELLRRKMLIGEARAVEVAGRQGRGALSHRVVVGRPMR